MNDTALFETPEPLTDADNVGPLYVDYRAQAADDALIGQARRRAQALMASQPGGEAGPQEAVPDGAAQPMTQAETIDAGGLESFGEGVVAGSKDLANFVIRSPIAAPRAAWYGLLKSAAALLSLPLEAGAAIDQLELKHGLISEETVRKHQRWIEAIKTAPDADTFLNVRPPETVTGNMVSGAIQFVSVAGRAAATIKALGASEPAANVGASFISATAAFQGSEATLAEWIQSNPKYANFVAEFLASDPDDSEAEKRLKNGLEGVLGGLVFDAFLGGLKMLKAGRAAEMATPQRGAAPLPTKPELAELTPDQLHRLGDPDAPLVQVVEGAPNSPPKVSGEAATDAVHATPDAASATKPEIATGQARYTTRGDQRFVQLASGTDDLGRIPEEAAKVIKREAGPIRLPEGMQDSTTGKGFGEVHIEAGHGKQIRDYGYDDAASFSADVAANYRFIYEGDKGGLFLVKPNGMSKIAVVELKEVPSAQSAFEAHWEVETAAIYRPGFFNSRKLLWQRPGPGNSSTGNSGPTSGNPLHPGDQSKASIQPSSTTDNTPTLALLDAALPDLRQNLRDAFTQASDGPPKSAATIVLGPVTSDGAQRINKLLAKNGIKADVSGYLHEVDAYAARHAFKEHGSVKSEAPRGQLQVTSDDWALIPNVLSAPDRVRFIGKSKIGRDVIGFWKQVNGHVLYVEEIRTGRKTLAAVSMRKYQGKLEALEDTGEEALVGGRVNAGAPTETLYVQNASPSANVYNHSAHINWSKIESGDDIQSVLRDLSDAFPDDVPAAQRGVASKEATQAAADALGMSVDDVLKQRKGVDFTPEQARAASRLLTASQEKLIEVARAASQRGATAADRYAFRRMLATQYAIQAEVLGAGSKTASALDTWVLPAGTGQERMRALEQRLLGSGGSEVSEALARRLSVLALAGVDPQVMNRLIRRAASANTMDGVRQIYVDGLLSTPLPHVANTAGGIFVAMQQIVERGVAGKIARATGSGGVAEGEATAMMYGLVSGQWDALRLASRTMMGKVTKPADWQLGKLEGPRFDLEQAGGPGRVVDYLGKVFGVGPKLLDGTDAYFKAIGYRMELHAQAFRQARSEGLEGAALDRRVAAIVADPPPNIRLAAADAALYNTFSNPNGAFGQALLKMRNGGGALNPLPFVLPFVRAPINVARYTFERTPLAPLVGQWRADIAAGGARRDLALARMAVGSTACRSTW